MEKNGSRPIFWQLCSTETVAQQTNKQHGMLTVYIFIPRSAAAPIKETSHRKNNHVIVEGRQEEEQLRNVYKLI